MPKLVNSKIWWYITNRYNQEYRKATVDLLEENSEAKYIDLGCGDGTLTKKMAAKIKTYNPYGVELVPELVLEARSKDIIVLRSELGKPIHALDNAFDVVTANQIIEHLDDTDTFIKECYRILKPGGYMVISTNNLATWHWIVMLMCGIQPPTACISDEMQTVEFGYPYQGNRLHRRLFTHRGLERVLKYYGFKIEKSVGTYFVGLPIWLSRIACRIDKYHSSCVVIKARK